MSDYRATWSPEDIALDDKVRGGDSLTFEEAKRLYDSWVQGTHPIYVQKLIESPNADSGCASDDAVR